jgi:hypothetical protein
LIRELSGAVDVTLTVIPDDGDGRIMVAVDGANAFLGLDRDDGLFQYARHHDGRQRTRRFTIGGQQSGIESRYVLSISLAATAVQEWLRNSDGSPLGTWERQ